MPRASLKGLLDSAPTGVLHLKREDLARLIAVCLTLWRTLYPNDNLVAEVKRAWKQTE